jgi:hypothetical protein
MAGNLALVQFEGARRMGGNNDSSILSRPPKLPPAFSLVLGLVCIPLGVVIQGMPGGVLVGAGVGGLVMAAWDFSRLRFVAWRRAKAERAARSDASDIIR